MARKPALLDQIPFQQEPHIQHTYNTHVDNVNNFWSIYVFIHAPPASQVRLEMPNHEDGSEKQF